MKGMAVSKSPSELGQTLISVIQRPGSLEGCSLRQWDVLLRLARRANLLAKLAEYVAEVLPREHVPAVVLVHLDAARTIARHQREAIRWECRHIERALADIDAPIVLLKGSAYAMTDLPPARGRLFGDIDILVPRAVIKHVEAALFLHGWSARDVDPYDDQYYRKWMHELPPLVHTRRGTVIDLHHNILPLTTRLCPPADLIIGASATVPGYRFRVPSHLDIVLHSAAHLFHEGELRNGLRDLFDLDSLMRHYAAATPDYWSRLVARAKELGLARPLHQAFRYVDSVLGTPVPIGALDAFKSDRLWRDWSDRLLDQMYLRALRPDHPLCSDGLTGVARLGLFVRSHALRMPPLMLAKHLGRKTLLRLFKHTSRSF
jgi:hypothetical protein